MALNAPVALASARPLPPLNLVRENGVSYPPSAGRVSLLGDSVIAAPQPGSAFNDRAIGQLSSIIITVIRISYATQRRAMSFRPFTATVFIYRNINPPPVKYMSSTSKIIGAPSSGAPPSVDALLRISVAPGPTFRRNETPFTSLRAFTHVAAVAEIPTKLSTFEHAPTTEYSENHTSAGTKPCLFARCVMSVEIFDRASLLFDQGNSRSSLSVRHRHFHCLEQ